MSLFHQHKWQETERFRAAPETRRFEAKWVAPKDIERMIFGLTTILYKCSICSEVKTVEILGLQMPGGANADIEGKQKATSADS